MVVGSIEYRIGILVQKVCINMKYPTIGSRSLAFLQVVQIPKVRSLYQWPIIPNFGITERPVDVEEFHIPVQVKANSGKQLRRPPNLDLPFAHHIHY